jgi:hypothetical protein
MNEFAKKIEDVALRLPNLPNIPRKNFFDILSIQRKEKINSKALAYFFDANEDHAYGELFKNALLRTIESKNVDINQAFYSPLIRAGNEEFTRFAKKDNNRNKWIDIVLEGDRWCIVIENKIGHLLNNPLDAYLEHAQSKKKHLLCVVLSLHPLKEKPNYGFINITHQDLINEVRKEIPFDTSIPEIDLFYLREYFKNIESHYFNLNNQPKMNDIISALAKNREFISDIEHKKIKAIDFIDNEIKKVFETFNYKQNDVWYVHPQDDNLSFWINDARDILENNKIHIFFEVWKELKNKTSEEEIHSKILINELSQCLNHDRVVDNLDRYKIVIFYEEEFIKENITFSDKLTEILENIFFSPNGIEKQAITKLGLGLEAAKNCK